MNDQKEAWDRARRPPKRLFPLQNVYFEGVGLQNSYVGLQTTRLRLTRLLLIE